MYVRDMYERLTAISRSLPDLILEIRQAGDERGAGLRERASKLIAERNSIVRELFSDFPELRSGDTPSSPERRDFGGEFEVRSDGDKPIIRASLPFNSLSVPMGLFQKFREQIAPSAFDSALNDTKREVLALWSHDPAKPLGRRTRGTLVLGKTEARFQAEIHPPSTTWGTDAVESIRRGDVTGLSFEFRVLPEGERWSEDSDKNLIRTLTNVELSELSPVARPAYVSSTASVRSGPSTHMAQQQEIL